MADELLSGWGRATWSRASVARPATTAAVVETARSARSLIARGLGRSYGDQATNAGGTVAELTGLREPLGAPSDDGRLAVPAGLSIDALLRKVVPLGWFVPVTPGTRQVTIGGAVAADVHGKNHHRDGSFCAHVDEVTLVVPDGTVVRCSPSTDAELFWATAGGMGLTGIIVEATVRLTPIETSRVLVDTVRFTDLDRLMAAMVEADQNAPSSVAWVDLMSHPRFRSVLTTGRFALVDDLPPKLRSDPLRYAPTRRLAAPAWVPNGVLRPSTVRAFNLAWFAAAPANRAGELQTIGRYFHPLDGVDRWNRVYGPQGFIQWQMAVPLGAEATVRRCVERLGASSIPCFLAVLKRFGPGNAGHLSFPIEGWTLTADMPAAYPGLGSELDGLDRMVAEVGGRIYLAKDARMDPALVPVMYPRLDEWRSIRDRVDPQRRLRSDLSRRLGL